MKKHLLLIAFLGACNLAVGSDIDHTSTDFQQYITDNNLSPERAAKYAKQLVHKNKFAKWLSSKTSGSGTGSGDVSSKGSMGGGLGSGSTPPPPTVDANSVKVKAAQQIANRMASESKYQGHAPQPVVDKFIADWDADPNTATVDTSYPTYRLGTLGKAKKSHKGRNGNHKGRKGKKGGRKGKRAKGKKDQARHRKLKKMKRGKHNPHMKGKGKGKRARA